MYKGTIHFAKVEKKNIVIIAKCLCETFETKTYIIFLLRPTKIKTKQHSLKLFKKKDTKKSNIFKNNYILWQGGYLHSILSLVQLF